MIFSIINMYKPYSQLGQDKYVLNTLYPGKTDGWFVEAGAAGGVILSNTLALEEIGWKGLCVEPIDHLYDELIVNRKCYTEKFALSNVSGNKLQFRVVKDNIYLSGIQEHMDINRCKGNDTLVEVTTSTLTDLLDKHNMPNKIQYLSLDIEGGEYVAIHGIDWDKYSFGVINIEHNWSKNRPLIRKFLEDKGYVYHKEDAYDDWYIHKDGLDSFR